MPFSNQLQIQHNKPAKQRQERTKHTHSETEIADVHADTESVKTDKSR